jgi:hypothetical protein
MYCRDAEHFRLVSCSIEFPVGSRGMALEMAEVSGVYNWSGSGWFDCSEQS